MKRAAEPPNGARKRPALWPRWAVRARVAGAYNGNGPLSCALTNAEGHALLNADPQAVPDDLGFIRHYDVWLTRRH